MIARILGAVGRSMVAVGILVLLFVAYQLWGTGIQEARSQRALGNEFETQLESAEARVPATDATTDSSSEKTTPDLLLPAYGQPVARIELPTIGVTRTVVEGVTVEQLARGPGHYPASPLPGQSGNVSIAGHRTTYGQPFHNIDKLAVGDEIVTTTVQGTFIYEVAGTEIVAPDAVRVLEDKGDDRLTLIACHPKYSLKQRIIVHALLQGPAATELEGQPEARSQAIVDSGGDQPAGDATIQADIDGPGLSGRDRAATPAVLWGLATAGIWIASWGMHIILRRRSGANQEGGWPSRRRRLLASAPYLLASPPFVVALYFFFKNFSLLLPGNY